VAARRLARQERALALARKLAQAPQRAAAWVGRDALRDLQTPATQRRMARKRG
jgi:hypothetical protein